MEKGVWKTPSWIAFLLARHIAQQVTRTRIPSAWGILQHIKVIHCFGLEMRKWAIKYVISSSSRAQTHLDIVRKSKECSHVSSSAPQILCSCPTRRVTTMPNKEQQAYCFCPCFFFCKVWSSSKKFPPQSITSNLAAHAWSIKYRQKKTNCTVWLEIARRMF